MMPRPVQCDDDRCDYDETGQWRHVPGCWAVEDAERDDWIEDAALDAAREDGYGAPFIPRQLDRRAA